MVIRNIYNLVKLEIRWMGWE